MSNQQTPEQKSEADFNAAKQIAEKQNLKGVLKWAFVCGYLKHKLATAYANN